MAGQMQGKGGWVFVGPREIQEDARSKLKERLEKHVIKKWKSRCRRVIIRFRRNFAYVDVLEASDGIKWKKQLKAAETIVTHLCRLRYLGSADRWEFAFYKYSDERYQLCCLPSGSFSGTPESCFDCAANVYLRE